MIKYKSEKVADVKPHDRASTPKKVEEQILVRITHIIISHCQLTMNRRNN